MSIIAEPFKKDNETFPQNKIILTDGTTLDCYPVADKEPENIPDDTLQPDTTGQYLRIGRHKATPAPQPATERAGQELFIDNAFYLLAHKDRILSDSRMFLCPVTIQNGLAYTGTSGFRRPTLGVYIEWWLCAKDAMQTDKKGRRSLVYHMAGSPLSGMNKCSAIREDGTQEIVSLSSFGAHWGPFMKLNQRYAQAKPLYQHYTLQQVLDILHQEDNGNTDCRLALDAIFMKREIDKLNQRIEQISKQCDTWREKYESTLVRYNIEKMRQVYADCEAFDADVTKEIDAIREQKKRIKASLKAGQIDNVTYQRQLTPMKTRIADLLLTISHYKYRKTSDTFPDETDIDYNLIEKAVTKDSP